MLLSIENDIKLTDLGSAKLMDKTTGASTYIGTPKYMSPEIFKAKVMDIKHYPNTDIW